MPVNNPLLAFPNDVYIRRVLPPPQRLTPPGELPSYRVIFERRDVPVFDPDNPSGQVGWDADGFAPLCAVVICSEPDRPPPGPGCKPDFTVFINDGLSRCTFALNEISVQAPAGARVLAQTAEFKIRGAMDNYGTTLWTGTVATGIEGFSPTLNPVGLVATVSGPLVTQFEVWARVYKFSENAQPMRVRPVLLVDRLGDAFVAYAGSSAGGGELPPVPVPE